MVDDVAGRKGERRAGVGTGAVEGSPGEERNESVKSKDRVHVSEWKPLGSVNMQYAQLPQVTVRYYVREGDSASH